MARTARGLASLSITDLTAELRRRRSVLPRLERKRAGIAAKVAALDAEIVSLGGTPNGAVPRRRGGAARTRRSGGPGSRGPRPGSVVSVLAAALRGKTMTVTEAVAAVRKAGYPTKAKPKSFYHAVAVVLAQSGRFRRVGRGRYKVR